MNQTEFNTAQGEYRNQIRELEVKLQRGAPNYMQYTTNDIKKLMERGAIPEDLGSWYIDYINEQNTLSHAWQNFCKENPSLTAEERMIKFYPAKTLSFEDTIKHLETMVNIGKIYNMLSKNTGTIGMEQLETSNLPDKLFNRIGDDEFAICRLIADPLNNIYKSSIFEKFSAPELVNPDTNPGLYITQAVCEPNAKGDTIRIEYRYRAANDEEAKKQQADFIQRLRGRQQKILEACWSLVNKKYNRLVSCPLTELMLEAYPDRDKSTFSTDDKIKFFQDLLDLSQTQMVVTKKQKKKNKIDNFLLPFITIHKMAPYNMASPTKSERYPNDLSYSVLHNPMYEQEKLYHVGAGFKQKTLTLQEEDRPLSAYIQIRKNQNQGEEYIIFKDKEKLLKMANLDGTKHKGMANKRLLDKLRRFKDRDIVKDFPEKVTFPFRVKVR